MVFWFFRNKDHWFSVFFSERHLSSSAIILANNKKYSSSGVVFNCPNGYLFEKHHHILAQTSTSVQKLNLRSFQWNSPTLVTSWQRYFYFLENLTFLNEQFNQLSERAVQSQLLYWHNPLRVHHPPLYQYHVLCISTINTILKQNCKLREFKIFKYTIWDHSARNFDSCLNYQDKILAWTSSQYFIPKLLILQSENPNRSHYIAQWFAAALASALILERGSYLNIGTWQFHKSNMGNKLSGSRIDWNMLIGDCQRGTYLTRSDSAYCSV